MKKINPTKKKTAKTVEASPQELDLSNDDWSDIGKGVSCFNGGKFSQAREAWEQVYKRHPESERKFLFGLMQLASAYDSFMNGKRGSDHRQFDEAYKNLQSFQPEYLGVHVKPILICIEEAKKEDSDNFPVVPKLQFHKPSNPDLIVELREILMNEKFIEGTKLFNTGYFWEAHEAWEEAWREQEGEGKSFLQAFVQMASAFSFLKLKKIGSAQYLIEKALEKFQEFEQIECPIALGDIRQALEQALQRVRSNGEPADHSIGTSNTFHPPTISLLKDL